MADPFDIFLACPPGLEPVLRDEAARLGLARPKISPGGVTVQGQWPDVWRANLYLRSATRVLARIGAFRALHLAQLDKRARKFPWANILRPDIPLRLDVTCRGSKIYHAGAAAQRIERAITETLGAKVDKDAPLRLMARIEDDLCTFSLDTSGAPLHRRGHKQQVGKAPLRETLAAAALYQMGFDGSQTVVDPMCGSGTFPLEAAEIAAGLAPGRSRDFAFADLASFDPAAWSVLRDASPGPATAPAPHMFGSDRDAGAIAAAQANAARANVDSAVTFAHHAVSDLVRPDGPPGLVMVNPPYGARIGNKKLLYALYGSLGQTLQARFQGWRLGLITSEPGLARATGITLSKGPPIPHGPLKISLYASQPL